MQCRTTLELFLSGLEPRCSTRRSELKTLTDLVFMTATQRSIFFWLVSIYQRERTFQVLARRALLRILYDDSMLALRHAQDPASPKPNIVEVDPASVYSSLENINQVTLRLQPGLTIHMYTSSVPCGNASLRRWAKPPRKDDEMAVGSGALTAGGWPSAAHPRILIHAREEGQVRIFDCMLNGSTRARVSPRVLVVAES
mmetsp:Transcript_14883/g.40717  ORF Transcript_14883/g.40717 Transcript_14883/m.40717 type:complete len:199 (+) Transcript_14883:175-771(+)